MKSLKPLNDVINNTENPIVGEFINESNSNNLEVFSPSIKLIGSKRECPTILNLINYLDKTNKKDYTLCQSFEGDISKWLKINIQNKKINYILGEIIGTRIDNKPIIIDNLLVKTDLLDKINDETLMIYINRDELVKRTRYNWFIRLSPEQIFNSRTTLAELFLISVHNK